MGRSYICMYVWCCQSISTMQAGRQLPAQPITTQHPACALAAGTARRPQRRLIFEGLNLACI